MTRLHIASHCLIFAVLINVQYFSPTEEIYNPSNADTQRPKGRDDILLTAKLRWWEKDSNTWIF